VEKEKLDGVAASFIEEHPRGYGRIVRSGESFCIVEEKDTDEKQKSITEVNSGLYVLRTEFVLAHLYQLSVNNKSREFYLTDLFQTDRKVKAVTFSDKTLFGGVNDLMQLQHSSELLR